MKKLLLLTVMMISINLFAGFNRYLPVNKWNLKANSLSYYLEFRDDYTFMLSYENSSLKFAHRLYGKYTINKDDTVTLYSQPLQITYSFKLPFTSDAKTDADLLTDEEKEFLDEEKSYSYLPVLIFKNMRLRDKSFKFHADNLSQNPFFGK